MKDNAAAGETDWTGAAHLHKAPESHPWWPPYGPASRRAVTYALLCVLHASPRAATSRVRDQRDTGCHILADLRFQSRAKVCEPL